VEKTIFEPEAMIQRENCTVMNIVILWSRGDELRGVNDTEEGTYMDPPADADATYKVCQEDGNYAVPVPIVSDADVAEVVTCEYKLVPEEAQKNCTKEERLALV
jgi:hypothetical protein